MIATAAAKYPKGLRVRYQGRGKRAICPGNRGKPGSRGGSRDRAAKPPGAGDAPGKGKKKEKRQLCKNEERKRQGLQRLPSERVEHLKAMHGAEIACSTADIHLLHVLCAICFALRGVLCSESRAPSKKAVRKFSRRFAPLLLLVCFLI